MDFKRGFTLVEILVGIGLIGAVSALIAALVFTNFRIFHSQNVFFEVTSDNRIALSEMTNQIRESQSVADSCCGGDTTGPNGLVLQLWPLNAQGEPFESATNFDYVVYKLNSDSLVKKVVPNTTAASTRQSLNNKTIATNVSTLTITYNPPGPPYSSTTEVDITLTTTKSSLGKTQQITDKAKAILRNK